MAGQAYKIRKKAGAALAQSPAKILRHRVRSYFSEDRLADVKTGTLISEARDVDYILVDNEKEALALDHEMRRMGEETNRSNARLSAARVDALPEHALIMHPGPMNRGVEMLVDPSTLPGSRILAQVANGVSMRMAVLFTLLGGAPTGLSQGE